MAYLLVHRNGHFRWSHVNDCPELYRLHRRLDDPGDVLGSDVSAGFHCGSLTRYLSLCAVKVCPFVPPHNPCSLDLRRPCGAAFFFDAKGMDCPTRRGSDLGLCPLS